MGVVERSSARRACRLAMAASLSALVLAPVVARAQTTTQASTLVYAQQRQVGGISINADGLIEKAGLDVGGKLGRLRATIGANGADANPAPAMRKISLRRLEAAIEARLAAGKPLGDEILLLGGLQQIRYVFVFPEQNDIVLMGPSEAWRADDRGNVGRANLRATRHATGRSAGRAAYGRQLGPDRNYCSIDPTADGSGSCGPT